MGQHLFYAYVNSLPYSFFHIKKVGGGFFGQFFYDNSVMAKSLTLLIIISVHAILALLT